ncbi:MAG: diguanylate cyclase [Sporichthyaceae bacterium]
MDDEAEEFAACARGATVRAACEGLTDDLRGRGVELPSVYLLIGGRLRCQAARGYFQVVDGFRPGMGVVGRTVTTGEATVLPDVAADPAFVAARPDLRGEVCVPVILDGRPVGAVNAESTGPLPPDWPPLLTRAAAALAARLNDLGGLPAASLTQRLAHAVAQLTTLSAAQAIEAYAARAAADLAGTDSACFITTHRDSVDTTGRTDEDPASPPGDPVYRVRAAVGPLAEAMRGFTGAQLHAMAAWVQAGTSSHFPGGSDTPPTYGFLAEAGIRALCLNPLVASGEHLGMLVVADRGELPHDPAVVEVLELLSAQTATAWTTAMTITGLRRRADLDPLTMLANRGAFHRDLADRLRNRRAGGRVCACLMVDVDGFKQVNDQRGHLAGDDLLRDLARVLRGALRDGDALYRVGGDELAALLDVRDGRRALGRESTARGGPDHHHDRVHRDRPGRRRRTPGPGDPSRPSPLRRQTRRARRRPPPRRRHPLTPVRRVRLATRHTAGHRRRPGPWRGAVPATSVMAS